MSVTISWQTAQRPVDDGRVAEAVEAALAYGGRPGAVLSVAFVDEPTLTELHARWLDDDSPTDVLAFDLGEGCGPSGEIYVSVDRARELAAERRADPARELLLYVVHGTLHLCGLDDHAEIDRRAMREAESAVLEGLGFPREGSVGGPSDGDCG